MTSIIDLDLDIIKSRLVDTDVDGFCKGPRKAMPLPVYYLEVFHVGRVARGGLVALY